MTLRDCYFLQCSVMYWRYVVYYFLSLSRMLLTFCHMRDSLVFHASNSWLDSSVHYTVEEHLTCQLDTCWQTATKKTLTVQKMAAKTKQLYLWRDVFRPSQNSLACWPTEQEQRPWNFNWWLWKDDNCWNRRGGRDNDSYYFGIDFPRAISAIEPLNHAWRHVGELPLPGVSEMFMCGFHVSGHRWRMCFCWWTEAVTSFIARVTQGGKWLESKSIFLKWDVDKRL